SLSAEFALGERSFGRSWRGKLDFEFRRGSTSFSYAETPTTQDNSRLRRNSLGGPDLPDDFLDRPGSGERYLSNRLEWLLNLNFNRTDFSFSLFDDERTERALLDGTVLPDESQRGALVSVSYR